MKIIYDEVKAIQDIAHVNAKTPERNEKARKHNRKLRIACAAGCGVAMFAVFAGACCLYSQCDFKDILHFYVLGVGFLMTLPPFAARFIYSEYEDPILDAQERYPVNAAFHSILQNYKVLGAECIESDGVFRITLSLENEEHEVSYKRITIYLPKKVERTDISETTVDLDTVTIYQPYTPAK